MQRTDDTTTTTFPVALEEGAGGEALVHSLTLPGCVAEGPTRDEALAAFPRLLADWLDFLAARGERVPAPEAELEVAVDEWVTVNAPVLRTGGVAHFDADLLPLTDSDLRAALARLGDLRSPLLRALRPVPDADLDRIGADRWTVRRVVDELARAQWWTLSRLGSSPLAEVPPRLIGRLDTAMALVIQQLTGLSEPARSAAVELDGELWTPRRVVRRLLWLEWTLGRSALRMLAEARVPV